MPTEKPKKEPERYGELHDPKLPQIHGQTDNSRMEGRIFR